MFVDEVILKVKAGNGGDGCTAFRREKYIPDGGPFGGNGGRGANIIFKTDLGLKTLLDLRYQKLIKKDMRKLLRNLIRYLIVFLVLLLICIRIILENIISKS